MGKPDACKECNGFPATARPGRSFKVCQCPASIGHRAPETLEEQVRALLPYIDDRDRIPFLAGMRFAQGFAEYGNGMFTINGEKLDYERDCEAADVYVMDLEKSRRVGYGEA